MNIIFAKHDTATATEYAFLVPDGMAKHIKQGDILWVDTMYGERVAVATTGVLSGDGARDIALRHGAYEPMKSVISYANAEMRKWIVRNATSAIAKAVKGMADTVTALNQFIDGGGEVTF